ncbi:hypothetical protein WR25_25087 [Diploscapter pachys]|uniref:Ubiquinone biosynthesis O-methyltransferase, mitochondrial n=1 Tax=Diploscapter pachys TaxID=2018661 RepID=A0A2A2LHZ4_9BILA|nr:hypothetical protein WR25_25087 [Diploscapter pachys]
MLVCRRVPSISRLQNVVSSQLSASTSTSSTVDPKQVDRFNDLAGDWSDERGPFKALHSLNRLRVPWIVNNSNKRGRALDIGCGGGLLTVPLARAGLNVTGIDSNETAINAARESLQAKSLQATNVHKRIEYACGDVEEFANQNQNGFDCVIASEVVEHVADVPKFVSAIAKAAKPNGRIFLTTINRTWASRVMSIWIAEDVMGIVPKGVHEWEKFVTPDELKQSLESSGCRVLSTCGLIYDPLCNRWNWTAFDGNNYALLAEKLPNTK